MIEKITDAQGKVLYQAKGSSGRQAIDERTAILVSAMLRRAVDQGTGTALRGRFGVGIPVAGKTGTSQDYGDAWFVGYTPGLVVGSWVGAREPSVHFSSGLGSGSQLALPLVGPVFAGIERSPDLRKKYVRSFPSLETDSLTFDCSARRDPSAIEQVIDDVFGPKRHGVPMEDTTKKENFFKRLFGKEDD